MIGNTSTRRDADGRRQSSGAKSTPTTRTTIGRIRPFASYADQIEGMLVCVWDPDTGLSNVKFKRKIKRGKSVTPLPPTATHGLG